MMNRSKWVAESAVLVALAMIFSYIEALIPFSFGVPGIKLGLANLVVLVALYYRPPGWVFVILIVRIMLVSILFGNMAAMFYSLTGGIFSFAVMYLLKKTKWFSVVGVSIAGGVTHNIGQLMVAALVVKSIYIFSYLPFLMIAGVCAGGLVGLIGKRVNIFLQQSKNILDN